MAYKQTRNFNQNAAARVGLCLQYVQNGFSSGWAGPDAWTAWTKHVKHRHGNRNFPKNVVIPIWFSGTWQGHYYGHVAALDTRTGRVYTSPYYKSTGYEWYASIDDLIRTFKGAMSDITYRGWSEDIGGTRIVNKKGSTPMWQNTQRHYDIVAQTFKDSTGRKLTMKEFQTHFVGRPMDESLVTIQTSSETRSWHKAAVLGRKAQSDNWQGQIHTLVTQVNALGKRPTRAQLDAANKKVNSLAADVDTARKDAEKAEADAKARQAELEKNVAETQQAEKEASNFLTAVVNAIRKLFNKGE